MSGIIAVAINTVKQILRLRIAVVFILLLAVLLIAMGLTATGDGTIKGRLQTFLSYGMSISNLLLSLLTIIASVYTVTSDISGCQIYTVVTKPIRRHQILTGKFLAVCAIDAVLVVIFYSTIYLTTILTPKFVRVSPEDKLILENEFFTARASLKPKVADVSSEVRKTFDDLVKRGQITKDEASDEETRKIIFEELTRSKEEATRSAGVGRSLEWTFENVNINRNDPNNFLFIRFKYEVSVNPQDSMINSVWRIGDEREIKIGLTPKNPPVEIPRRDRIRTFQEIAVPASVVAPDGHLWIEFWNPILVNEEGKYFPANETVVIFPPDCFEVLYKADVFSVNFLRGVLLIFLRLVFLAALGIFTASFLSMPVALLFCLIIFSTAAVSGFIFESFETLSKQTEVVYSVTIKPLMLMVPQFDRINPSTYLVPGRLISWVFVGKAAAVIICIQSLILFLIGIFLFSRREIAKIIV